MPRRSPAALAAVAALLVLAAAASLRVVGGAIADPPAHRVQFQADDGFYYLTLARHFATEGRWTFDGGVSLTTGFHLLHAYALAIVFRLFRPGPEGFVHAALVLSWLALLPALAAAAIFCVRTRSVPSALLVFVLLASRNTSLNAIGLMEWPWVVSIAACYVAAVAAFAASGAGAALTATAALGFLASLARTDAGLLPAAILGGAFVAGPLCGAHARRWRVAAAVGLAGAVAGLGAVFVHNAIVSGQMVQSSVLMKRLWLAEQGWSIVPLYTRLVSLFGPFDRLTKGTCAIVGVAVAAALGQIGARPSPRPLGAFVIWIGSAAAVAAYAAFYAFNVTTFQPWYTANLVVPLFLAIALPLASIGPASAAALAATAGLTLLAGRVALVEARPFADRVEYPFQAQQYDAGVSLLREPPPGRVGSFNAGIVGYYQGGSVVNVDGLVNDDIYVYAARNRLADYFDRVPLRYLVEYTSTLETPMNRRRSGFDDSAFLKRLEPVKCFGDSPVMGRLCLFRVAPASTPPLR